MSKNPSKTKKPAHPPEEKTNHGPEEETKEEHQEAEQSSQNHGNSKKAGPDQIKTKEEEIAETE